MLIALFTILYLGASSTGLLDYIAESTDNVESAMVNDERRKAALGTLKAMKKITKARNKQVKRVSKELRTAFAGADTSDQELEEIWNGHFVAVNRYDHEMVELRFELKDQLTREEWAAVFSELSP